MKVLIVDNNDETLNFLSDIMEKEGLLVIKSQNGAEAVTLYNSEKPDFLCLDIMMPDMNGYDVCKEIRKTDMATPIIFISSKSQPFDKILGLELGADDYITKPFDIGEVLARIRAVSRRCIFQKAPEKNNNSFKMGDLEILPNQLRAKRGQIIIDLSLREINILKLLHKNKGDVVNRDMLLDECWGAHIMTESRTIDWHISKLRKNIEKNPKNPLIIQTVHGVGYKFEELKN